MSQIKLQPTFTLGLWIPFTDNRIPMEFQKRIPSRCSNPVPLGFLGPLKLSLSRSILQKTLQAEGDTT
ncbi:hypothetical protein DPEC_G00022450 [Dallia pectoralis]|uniref:Uncharacterized protein n=1 Tax=Dallia pectoralis TaxID=75939 RepID=A0ACC2HHZ1_DALPE|nr:hypothetical protein DPEC_G00022450 [Dallia pectoralis]